mgnify:CR=1 FL=1
MKPVKINHIYTYPFTSRSDLIHYLDNQHKILIAVNAEKIIKRNPRLEGIINNNIGYADGIGAVKALKRKGFNGVEKIPGCECWLEIIRHFESEKSFYFVGSTDEVINQTIKKLHQEFPRLKILNFRSGFLKNGEKNRLITDLQEKAPDIVFVAMGTPRQEYLMEELLQKHPALYMGLGGSFDVYTGNVKRAPTFFINTGLEWFYRLLRQPTRIKRQLILLKFFWKLYFGRM